MPKTHRTSAKRARREATDKREEELTAALFGGGGTTQSSSTFLKPPPAQTTTKRSSHRPEYSNDDNNVVTSVQPDDFAFQIDRVGDHAATDNGKNNEVTEQSDPAEESSSGPADEDEDDVGSDNDEKTRAAVWVDEDDIDVDLVGPNGSNRLRKLRTHRREKQVSAATYERRLRERFVSTTQNTAHTEWAAVHVDRTSSRPDGDSHMDDSATNDDHDGILTSADALLATRGHAVPANIINLERCPDLNLDDPNRAVVQAVDFHKGSDPNRPMAVTAGLDKTLRFFQVTAEKSEKIHGIHFPKLPVYSASFLGTTGTVVVSGRRSYFYLYDSVAGKVDEVPRLVGRPEKSLERSYASPDGRTVAFVGNDGYVILFDIHNKAVKKTVKLNGSVRAICFQGDGEVLASGSDGDVYRWDLRGASRLPLERFSNQDGSITSTLAASSRTLAVGSESGVVNLYSEVKGRSKEPLKSIMNIRTPINQVCFNPDGNMLAMSSRMERDSLKLVHVPTGTVFSNWPTANTPLGYVWSTSFSPGSKFLAIGNDKGKCLLYKLQHYYAATAKIHFVYAS